jgi:glycosyltransferase involved in cell wall biosynthesis
MRVLVVGPGRNDIGGVANYYNSVLPRLSNDEITVHYLEIGSTHGRSRALHIILDQIRFWQTLGSIKPDVVHLNPSLVQKSFLRDGLFIIAAKMRNKPVLVFFRGWDEAFEKNVSGWLKLFFRITYSRVDAFIVLSSRFSKRLREWGVQVPIHMGTTAVADELLEGFSIESRIAEISNARTIKILFMARLEKVKGVLELIEAIGTLLKNGVPVSLTIAGDSSIMREVEKAVASLKVPQDAIVIAGYLRSEKKIRILESHHVFCFPTEEAEGMPNAVLEAMAFGMPIITRPAGGIADFFVDGEMGILLAGNEPVKIAEAISSIISNRARLAAIAQHNYQYAQRRFLATGAAEMLRTRYLEMVNPE